MTDFTSADLDSLAGKLDALDLTAGERAALDAVFEAATGDVAAFGRTDVKDSHDRHANLEIGSFGPRLINVLGTYIGETEKNLGQLP